MIAPMSRTGFTGREPTASTATKRPQREIGRAILTALRRRRQDERDDHPRSHEPLGMIERVLEHQEMRRFALGDRPVPRPTTTEAAFHLRAPSA